MGHRHARTLIEKLRFELARLKRQQFGASSEKLDGRVAQLELAIEALETDRAEHSVHDEVPASAPRVEEAGPKPARRPLPDHLPREEVIHPGPCACPSCGGKLRRIGSDVTETLDYVPGRFKVVRHVREAFSCRACETVVQAPAPFHAIARGRAGPGLLAHIMVAKFDDHLPLYRQAEIYAREGVTLETSTLSGWVGATAAALMPLVDLLRRDVIAGSTVLQGDDTPVPILAPGTGKTRTGRLWTYVRDERPHGFARPSAAVFFASPDRKGAPPLAHLARFSGVLQADGYAGFNGLYESGRRGGVLGARAAHVLRRPRRHQLDDGRIALDNNPAERAMRSVAVGRKNYLFAGSDRGAERAAALYSLIETAKLNGRNPEACLRDVLAPIAEHPASKLNDLLPWRWKPNEATAQAA